MRRNGRVLIVITMLMMLTAVLPACGNNAANKEVIKKLMDVNQTEQLLQKCDGIRITNEFYGGVVQYGYFEKDMVYDESGDEALIITTEETWVYKKESDTLCKVWYAMPEQETKIIKLKPTDYLLYGTETSGAKALEVVENQDQTTTIRTEMSTKDSVRILREGFSDLPKEYYSCNIKCIFQVETATYQILSCKWYVEKDGKELTLKDSKIILNGEKPELFTKMLEQTKEYKEKEENPKTKKIVSVYYDAGSKYEEVFTITVDETCIIQPYIRDDYTIDEDHMERITDDDGTIHINWYVMKQ